MSRANTSPEQIGEELFGIEPSVGSADCRYGTWAETANIPVLVLSELRLHKLLGLDSQPWFYLRLKGLQVYWVVRGGIRRLSRKEKKNSYNGTDKSVPFPEPGREASCPSLTPAW